MLQLYGEINIGHYVNKEGYWGTMQVTLCNWGKNIFDNHDDSQGMKKKHWWNEKFLLQQLLKLGRMRKSLLTSKLKI